MREVLQRDSQGLFRREFGRPRYPFRLGADRQEALDRCLRLEQVWAGVEQMWQQSRRTDRPVWTEATLAVAHAVAGGEAVAVVSIPDDVGDVPRWLDHLLDAMPIPIRLRQDSLDRLRRLRDQAAEAAARRRADLGGATGQLAATLAPLFAVPQLARTLGSFFPATATVEEDSSPPPRGLERIIEAVERLAAAGQPSAAQCRAGAQAAATAEYLSPPPGVSTFGSAELSGVVPEVPDGHPNSLAEMLGPHEVARILGCSYGEARQRMHDGRIRAVRDGRWCRTRREWIDEYLERIAVEPGKATKTDPARRPRTRRVNATGELGKIATEFLRERRG